MARKTKLQPQPQQPDAIDIRMAEITNDLLASDKYMASPRCCFTCQRYTHVSYEHDPLDPQKTLAGYSCNKKRSRYGNCSLDGASVWATEVCDLHDPEPDMYVYPVTNRATSRTPRQAKLIG